jgi:magnesium chelatase family protein
MGFARTRSVSLVGLAAHVVTVEADIAAGLPQLVWTGLPDAAVRQSANRVQRAVSNSREHWPTSKITIGLSPAAVPKSGSGLDLAIAVAVLAASKAFEHGVAVDVVMIGELGLDGRVKPVPGVLPAVVGAVRRGLTRVVVARANAAEAGLVPGIEVTAVGSLAELCAVLRGEPRDEFCDEVLVEADSPARAALEAVDPPDLADVVGQSAARWATEVTAAGGHHLYLDGPPGVGKTMLAERLPGLLPALSDQEALEVTAIHSLLGQLPEGRPLITRPPFCAPHHSASVASLVGGGVGIAGPGAISLAHRGVLFLDEAPEFSARALDALRQPVESGQVTISRSRGVTTYPSRFLLVLAGNPCPCAKGGGSSGAGDCVCTAQQRRRYRARLSGPFEDRMDVRCELLPVSRAVLQADAVGESTQAVAARVQMARDRARRRLAGTAWTTNAEVPGPTLRKRWPVPAAALRELFVDVDRGRLSTRGVDRVLKVAWTVADLAGHDRPDAADIDAARSLRFGALPRRLARSA